MPRRRLTAFLARRIVEAFLSGQSMAEIARRFRIARERVERCLRRHL
jgi:uncharacterized protein (DUF433 family)